jgi:glycosyltransferase involved in cell wall biosynthesis
LATKKNIYSKKKIHFVAPSEWIASQARSSSLLNEFPISVIPNGLNTKVFKPNNQNYSKNNLGISKDKLIILFGAMNSDTDKNKGLDLLIESLNILCKKNSIFAKKLILVIFGNSEQSVVQRFPLQVLFMGVIKDEQQLVNLYSAADVTVVPSRSESFGQVATESLSCATPVVAFRTSGLLDIVDHLKTGYLANPFNASDLANGISFILENFSVRIKMAKKARLVAVKRFDVNVIAEMHLNLYEKLLLNK